MRWELNIQYKCCWIIKHWIFFFFLQTILCELYERAYTTEVFEPWPTQQKCRKYYEIVAKEGSIDIPSLDISIIANLLSSFLHNLPDCLLCVDLYDDWVKAIDIRNKRERKETIFALCQKLPKQNYVLLQYMLKIFRHMIDNNVPKGGPENRITPYTIASMVGHLMLWPTHPCTKRPKGFYPEEGNEHNEQIDRKVRIVIVCLMIQARNYIINIWWFYKYEKVCI